MSAPTPVDQRSVAGPAAVLAGVAVAFLAWLLPVNLKSLSPALLRGAGAGTPSLAAAGRQLVEVDRIGPATLVLTAARAVGDPGAPALSAALDRLVAREPAYAAWGGWDPFLDPLFDLHSATGHATSTPVLTFFITEKARATLRAYLARSGSSGVQALLRTRELAATGRFVPARRPGGQPLDALILLSALLYQGEHLSPPLQRELHELADGAELQKALGDLEPFYLDLLSLGRRLDWVQLSELLRRSESVRTVGEYAQLARVAPDEFALIYAAALSTDSADRVADYLLQYGKSGAADLRLALGYGQGAVRLLVTRQVPVNRSSGPALSDAAAAVLAHPQLMLFAKYLGYFLGLLLCLSGLDRWIVTPAGTAPVTGAAALFRTGFLALFLAAMVILVTEPFLLRAAPLSEYRVHLALPMLAASGSVPSSPPASSPLHMNSSTLISIGIFALLQVMMYFICLRKINQISAQAVPPLLKLRLMENEENLFDSGLYVGMMGTAAALVLQVLGVIEPNLLAAYSSNLFGLVCVALVKVRHVRGFKRQLILEADAQGTATR